MGGTPSLLEGADGDVGAPRGGRRFFGERLHGIYRVQNLGDS